jgi:uncharacterized protein (TIGR02646 family)
MIKTDKDFADVPEILKSENRKEAFEANIAASDYIDEKNLYKVGSVQKKLKEIYHLKCAFCEKKLLDAPKHIEHYRPKSHYYWLAYSWDNLLLACGECNSAKGDRFTISSTLVSYKNERFDDIHHLGNLYDTVEKPFIINPEKEDILAVIQYNKEAKIFSADQRVTHTIEEACKLNRSELVEKRALVLNDFINKINSHYFYFIQEGDITRFLPEIETFIANCTKDKEFYSFRYYIFNNIEAFFDDQNIAKILKGLIDKRKITLPK